VTNAARFHLTRLRERLMPMRPNRGREKPDEDVMGQLESAATQLELGLLLSHLNFFRAAGVSWNELRHSDFNGATVLRESRAGRSEPARECDHEVRAERE